MCAPGAGCALCDIALDGGCEGGTEVVAPMSHNGGGDVVGWVHESIRGSHSWEHLGLPPLLRAPRTSR